MFRKNKGAHFSSRRHNRLKKLFNLKSAFIAGAAIQIGTCMALGLNAAGGTEAMAGEVLSSMAGTTLSSIFGGVAGAAAGLGAAFGLTKLSRSEGLAESAIFTTLGTAGLAIGYTAGAIAGPMMYL